MPFWVTLGLGLLGLWQQKQAADAQAEAMRQAQQGGLSPEELADLERRGVAGMKTDLSRRGMLDSGLLTGGRAVLTGELALAKARARAPFQQSYINLLLNRAQQPSFVSQLVPLIMQYGQKGPGGQWWLPPFGGARGGAPAAAITPSLPGMGTIYPSAPGWGPDYPAGYPG